MSNVSTPQTNPSPPQSDHIADAQTFEATEATSAVESSLHSKVVGSFLRGIPTLAVLVLLGGAAWWGHHHGWSIPSFSTLTGDEPVAGELWCDEHGVPEADCISCNAELLPKGELFGWCKEHGVHECVLHHPHLTQLAETPSITQGDLERAARAIAARPRTKNDSLCKMHLRRIQFPSIKAVDRAGIDINLVDRGPVLETIRATGEVVYDPTRVAHLSTRAAGTIWRVEKQIGDAVRAGDVMALVDAAEVGRIKSQLLHAAVQVELNENRYSRISRLGREVIPAREIDEAKTARSEAEFKLESAIQALSNLGLRITKDQVLGRDVNEVRDQLRFLGLPDYILNSIKATTGSTNLIPVVAPRNGVVVMREAVAGEVIETDELLFTVADPSQMWLLLNVPLEEAERITLDQKIVFHPDGASEPTIGHITWISTDVDRQTRTVQVRAELANANGKLRNETFGSGEIVLREEDDVIVVPSSAIHWEGCCHVAFVRDKNYFDDDSYKVFHTRSVRPGAVMGDQTEVIAGLLPGEVVITKGSGVLRAELLKGNLGAG